MRLKKKIVLPVVLAIVMILSIIPVYADSTATTLVVSVNSVNIDVNGVKVAVTGESYALSNGTEVPYSILYAGTTYLPMRKVAELVGKNVAWNQETKSASISNSEAAATPAASTAEAKDGTRESLAVTTNGVNIDVNNQLFAEIGDSYMLDNGYNVPYSLLYKGTTYLPMRKVCELVGKDVAWDQATKTASIKDMSAIADYKDYAGAPDFGAMTGLTATESEFKDGELSVLYDGAAVTEDMINKYVAAMFNAGYYFIAPVTMNIAGVDMYFDTYGNEKNIIAICYAQDATESVFLVYVSPYDETAK